MHPSFVFLKQLFLAYLRGIETQSAAYVKPHINGFLAYLRGIETSVHKSEALLHFLVFSLPKRD